MPVSLALALLVSKKESFVKMNLTMRRKVKVKYYHYHQTLIVLSVSEKEKIVKTVHLGKVYFQRHARLFFIFYNNLQS